MPYNRLKSSLSFTGGQKYSSCPLKKICPTAIQSICEGVGCSVKGKAWVAEGQFQQSCFKPGFHPEATSFWFQGQPLQEIWLGSVCLFCTSTGFSFLFFLLIRKWDFQCIVFSAVGNFNLRYYLVWMRQCSFLLACFWIIFF